MYNFSVPSPSERGDSSEPTDPGEVDPEPQPASEETIRKIASAIIAKINKENAGYVERVTGHSQALLSKGGVFTVSKYRSADPHSREVGIHRLEPVDAIAVTDSDSQEDTQSSELDGTIDDTLVQTIVHYLVVNRKDGLKLEKHISLDGSDTVHPVPENAAEQLLSLVEGGRPLKEAGLFRAKSPTV